MDLLKKGELKEWKKKAYYKSMVRIREKGFFSWITVSFCKRDSNHGITGEVRILGGYECFLFCLKKVFKGTGSRD